MSLIWVVLGTIVQLALSCALMVLPFFIGMAAVNMQGGGSSLQDIYIILFTLILPASSWFSAGIVIYKYCKGGERYNYWWYALPLFLSLICLIMML